jgi:zinc D-Ala-D-Ala carboxypeptidase
MQLTPNFHLDEFTLSQTASRLGIKNTPSGEIVLRLKTLAEQLEQVRAILNNSSILISSGYRSPQLNQAVKGSKTSQHMQGEAVDFTAPRFGTPREIVERVLDKGLEFDQIILEFDRWVHFSYKASGNRRQALIIDRNGARKFS